jgi:hypothetical protein
VKNTEWIIKFQNNVYAYNAMKLKETYHLVSKAVQSSNNIFLFITLFNNNKYCIQSAKMKLMRCVRGRIKADKIKNKRYYKTLLLLLLFILE